MAQALKVCQLSGTTVEVEREKCKIHLAHTGPQAVSTVRYHCGGGEDQEQNRPGQGLRLCQLSGTTVEVERTKSKIDLAQALRLCQLSGTTVEVERTKCRIDLAQALKLCQLSGTTVELKRTNC
jgi:hypothetical protein